MTARLSIKRLLQLIREAGRKDDHEAFMRLYAESRIDMAVARRAYDDGRRAAQKAADLTEK